MNSSAYRKKDRRYLWHPYSKYSDIAEGAFPVITRGKGIYLFDDHGKRYIDAISSWWACNLGHGHPQLIQAIRRQVPKLQHSILGNLSHPLAIELAETIVASMGETPRHVFFSSDGASAVEAALKIAVQYWHNLGQHGRIGFVSLKNAYHGDTLGAVSVGYLPGFHAPYKRLLFKVYRAESPCCGTCAWGRNANTCKLECFKSMRTVIERNKKTIAAVIIEPLCQAAAGMRIYASEYLTALAALCRKQKIMLIVDEIAMGFGRTGSMYAFQQAGIDPDIVCLGKGLSGGCLPISATVVKDKIYDTFRDKPKDGTFYHGHTFAGNPIGAAAALGTFRIYKKGKIVKRAKESGEFLAGIMRRLSDLPGVKNVRCLGMIAAVELENESERQGAARARAVREYMLSRGILIRPLGNVVYFMPPLITPRKILELMVNELCHALTNKAFL